MKIPLIVIDMQPAFTAHKEALKPVLREVINAKKALTDIIIVEFDLRGREWYQPSETVTHPAITRSIKNYKHKHLVLKEFNDGGGEILEYCRIQGIPTNTLRVCGVNTTACVKETVRSLTEDNDVKKIIIAGNACADNHVNKTKGLRILRELDDKIVID